MRSLATIGYEGASSEDFDDALRRAKIELLVDVRAVAGSRRRGFSKTALSDRLRNAGVGYVHFRELGDPKPGRVAARAGNLPMFQAIFSAHLETLAAREALDALRRLAATHRVALLCFEADAATCHRAIVASRIAKLENLSIVHLKVEPGQAVGSDGARTDDHPREGLAAA